MSSIIRSILKLNNVDPHLLSSSFLPFEKTPTILFRQESTLSSIMGTSNNHIRRDPSDSTIFSNNVDKVMEVILDKDRNFTDGFRGTRDLGSWTADLVSEVLRSIPRFYFQRETQFGCQKGFRRRSPLKQRDLVEELKEPNDKCNLKLRNPKRVEEGVERALGFYNWLESEGRFCHNEITCKEMACLLAKSNNLKKLWAFLFETRRKGHSGEIVSAKTVTAVIRILGEEGFVREATMAFYRMKQFWCKPDVVTYNTLIGALCRIGHFKMARYFLYKMELPGSSCPPDTFTYTIFISSYCKHSMRTGCRKAIRRRLWEANHLFRIMIFNGYEPDVVTYNCLIDGLCKNYRIGRAHELLNLMISKGCNPNRVTYNSFIRYYSVVNEVEKAIEMLNQMRSFGHGSPTSSSFTPIVHAFCERGKVQEACDFLIEMVDSGSVPRVYTYNLVLSLLKDCRERVLPYEVRRKIEMGICVRSTGVKKLKQKMVTTLKGSGHQ